MLGWAGLGWRGCGWGPGSMQVKGTSLEQPCTPSHLRVLRLPTVCEGPGLLGTKAVLLCRVLGFSPDSDVHFWFCN